MIIIFYVALPFPTSCWPYDSSDAHFFSYLKINECMNLTYDATKLNINENTVLPHATAAYKARNIFF